MPNYDEKTGIHYGVISPHSICQETLSDLCFGPNSTDPHYEAGKREIINDLKEFCEDHNMNFDQIDPDQFIDQYSDHYENSDGQYDYEDTEYTLHICDDNFGIFVIKSPYYTYTKQCSLCAPGAGDLDSPISLEEYEKGDHNAFMYGTVKAYCLPVDFFNEYSPIKYRYYKVTDDKEVIPEVK